MALHDEFVPTMWDLQCGFGFTTVVSRRFSKLLMKEHHRSDACVAQSGKPDAICAPAKCRIFDQKIYSYKDLSIFGRARLLGIGNEEDVDTDGDESTHSPPVCHHPQHRILTIRRGKKHAKKSDNGTQGVNGDSGDVEATSTASVASVAPGRDVEEIATQISRSRRIGFRPKDEVVIITS